MFGNSVSSHKNGGHFPSKAACDPFQQQKAPVYAHILSCMKPSSKYVMLVDGEAIAWINRSA